MADSDIVTQNGPVPKDLPTEVDIDAERPPRHTPREMSLVESMAGKRFQDFGIGEAEQAMAWFQLRRLGFDPTWEQAGDIFVNTVTLDPTNVSPNVVRSTTSPPSVISGE